MLSLWYYFWDQAAWLQQVTGTADVRLRGIKCSAVGAVPHLVPAGGGWAEYEHVLSLNQPHWSARRPLPTPELPQTIPEITCEVYCEQAHGEVAGELTMIDQELEMVLALVIAA